MNSRSSGLTTVKTTSAVLRRALEDGPRRLLGAHARVQADAAPEWGNCSIAARTTFSAVSPVESLRISMRRVSKLAPRGFIIMQSRPLASAAFEAGAKTVRRRRVSGSGMGLGA